ncbi:Fic/DOC family protein [Rheinheimera oceanensis]|uniref:Fic/DOC family protein n=1 Tax=Rheinheimera oceanensis TaxID=2817449 RepID=UPI001BFD347B|nr:Fic family protein [Rheinheimera oceanensis]
MDKYDEHGDRYCYPNSVVLRNKLGIQDEETFENAEREITEISIGHIHYKEPPYSLPYLQNIHYLLFNELYDWAGEIRTVDISKIGTRFCTVRRIEPEINKIFSRLEKDSYLLRFSGENLISKLAEYYGDFNIIHPFREGNGRVQRIFFDHIALHNGYRLNWNAVKSEDEWIQANIDSVLVQNERLESIFNDILEPIR